MQCTQTKINTNLTKEVVSSELIMTTLISLMSTCYKNIYIKCMLGSQKLNLELAATISRNPVENEKEQNCAIAAYKCLLAHSVQ